MTEADIEISMQGAKEKKYPGARPRIISDNVPQFIAKGFQGIYPDLRYDPRPDFAVLPAIERKN